MKNYTRISKTIFLPGSLKLSVLKTAQIQLLEKISRACLTASVHCQNSAN